MSREFTERQSTTRCQIVESTDAMRRWRQSIEGTGETLGLVPTMGALHEGHLTLIRRARTQCGRVAVSIFVNPLQFGPNEDFDKYPRTFERDVQLCEEAGVDVIFHPSVEDLYAHPAQALTTTVVPPSTLSDCLDGAFRPGFFTGVATVVSKLFAIVRADSAYFGEKDYQQLQVVKQMVADLSIPIEIVGCPTVRQSDGLALSSRNIYLSEEQRLLAPVLQTVLRQLIDAVEKGSQVSAALAAGRQRLRSTAGVELQYLELCHADSLKPLDRAHRPMVALVAAKLGSVRLIDNIVAR
ncbi:MAG TPA: pantoate--beta-alanine ligase [Planktothrix sp.]|jgi:pantoate--beta-alanine ligase